MRAALLATTAAGVLAVACSSSHGAALPQGSTAPAPLVTSASTSLPALWTTAEAQKQYLAIVKSDNADLDSLNKLLKAQGNDIAPYNAVCVKLAADDDSSARQFADGKWPAKVQPAIDAFIPAITTERVSWQTCATATTTAGITNAVNSVPNDASGKAEAVRIALGLPGTN